MRATGSGMKYAAYLRKSRADAEAEARGEGETLARHRAILSALAARGKRPIAEWYQEIVSGETISARPEMQRLLADVGAGRWAGVYVMEVERLARGDTIDQGIVAQAFKMAGVKIITPAKVYDPLDEFDEEYFEFSLFMSRREYKTINRRIQAGRMQSVREGKYIGSRPAYGYRKAKLQDGKGYTLSIDPGEAAVVRQIYHWYIHGDEEGRRMGLTRIAARLEDLRVPPGEQGEGWKACRIHRILHNEVYLGKIRWGAVRTQRELTQGGIEKRLVTSSDYELHEGRHEPIIDGDTFRAAEAAARGRANVPVRRDHDISNPLAGLLVCRECGHLLRALPGCGRQPGSVFCATRGCPCVRSYREPVERAILDTLRAWLCGFEAEICAQKHETQIAALEDAAVSRLRAELEAIQRQKNSLHDLLEQGVYTAEVFAQRHALLALRTDEAEAALQRLAAKKEAQPIADAEIAPEIRHVLDAYAAAQTAREKNGLLRSVISKAVYAKSVRGMRGVPPDQFQLTIYPTIRA